MENNDKLHSLENLENVFDKATKHMETLVPNLDTDQLLKFYGLYKQAVVGPCNISKPSWYQVQAKSKWEAWKTLGDMSREEAMKNYISAITKIDPVWEENSKFNTASWNSVSCMPNTEIELDDIDKTIFDWVKEGNTTKVDEMLRKDSKLVDLADGDGLLLIHWAADRGHVNIMKCLIENGSNKNARDIDGQTPLHYAASCGHLEAVKYLLSIGAESLEDNDGLKPKDIADDCIATILQ